MQPKTLFYILIAILIVNFIVDKILDALNNNHFNDTIPNKLKDVYNAKEYKKAQAYKKLNHTFTSIRSSFSFFITLLFFFLEGFKYLDNFARSFTNNSIIVALLFFGIIMLVSEIISTPFSYYQTFVIEEKFGFNKSTKTIFWTDTLKGLLLGTIIGSMLLATIIWFYALVGVNFWMYAWLLVSLFTIFTSLFYAKLIVPLFNKQTPLEDGELKAAIEKYAKKIGFTLKNIFVINGSKRSTKANAYFSGFGNQKRITLYDTLINDLETEEIVAVLAHEVGHYKKQHVFFNLIISILITGITFYVLSLCINSPILSETLGVANQSFHIGLITFGFLYSPISEITSLCMNLISRKFEYQADNFAKETYAAKPLIMSLKKLSKNNLSNLTPHPAYVFMHYSHPTLLQRIKNLES